MPFKDKHSPAARASAIKSLRQYRERRKADPIYRDARRNACFKSKYGIDIAIVDQMLLDQGGKCKICLRSIEGYGNKRRKANVDHDHMTGEVRSLLCSICNAFLGRIKDDPIIASRAAAYLAYWADKVLVPIRHFDLTPARQRQRQSDTPRAQSPEV